MNPRVCASVTGQSLKEIATMIDRAEVEGADFIEIRFDYLKEQTDPYAIRRLTQRPLIAANRLTSDGGLFKGREEERQRLLLEAARAGFNLVDLELCTPRLSRSIRAIREAGARIIVSVHTTSRPTMDRLESALDKERQLRPDICKIVSTAQAMGDNITCLQFIAQASTLAELVCFCMGPMGVISRVLSPLFGGAFTYAAVVKGREAAPGQLTVAEMNQFYRLLGV